MRRTTLEVHVALQNNNNREATEVRPPLRIWLRTREIAVVYLRGCITGLFVWKQRGCNRGQMYICTGATRRLGAVLIINH